MGIEKRHGWKSILISQYHAGLHNARAFSILSIQIQSVYISISRFEIQIYKRCTKVMWEQKEVNFLALHLKKMSLRVAMCNPLKGNWPIRQTLSIGQRKKFLDCWDFAFYFALQKFQILILEKSIGLFFCRTRNVLTAILFKLTKS